MTTRLTREQRREVVRQARTGQHMESASGIVVRRAEVILKDGKPVLGEWSEVKPRNGR